MPEAVIEIARDAQLAYECLCDIRSVPRWVSGVAKVDVLEVDDRSRPTLARFISMPNRASVSYTVRYVYDDATMTVRWTPTQRGERTLDGKAEIAGLDDGRCQLRYRLTTWNAASIPMWAHAELKQDSAQITVEAFRRWVERQVFAPCSR